MGHSRLGAAAGLVVVLVAAVGPAVAEEPGLIGVRLGWDRALDESYVAAELILPLARSWYLDGNVEYADRPASQYLTINLDVHYLLRFHHRWFGWVGAGLGLLSEDPNGPTEPDTRDGVGNLLLGVGFDGPAIPYVQARWSGHRGGRFSVGVGVRF